MNGQNKSLSSAIEEAQNILNAAESRAEKILHKAELEYASAKENGFAAGLELGKQEASATAVRLIQESTAISQQLADQAARLAIAIAEDVVGKCVEIDLSLVKEIAAKALKESVVGSNVRILVNPKDQDTIEVALPELKKLALNASLSIETDPSLTRGGCIVRTDFGEVDSTISTLVQMVQKKLGL